MDDCLLLEDASSPPTSVQYFTGRPSPNTALFTSSPKLSSHKIMMSTPHDGSGGLRTRKAIAVRVYCVHGYSFYNILRQSGRRTVTRRATGRARSWRVGSLRPARRRSRSSPCTMRGIVRPYGALGRCAGWPRTVYSYRSLRPITLSKCWAYGAWSKTYERARRPSTAEANQRRRAGAAISASRGANALAERAWDTEPAQAARD